MSKIMAFDPGHTTGIVIYTGTLEKPTVTQVEGLKPLWKTLNVFQPAMIVYESFLYQRRDKVDLRPVEAIGVIKLYAAINRTPIMSQTPSQGKAFWTDDRLKKLDLWETGQPHAMDALRHLLYYQAFKLNDKTLLERLK